MMKDIAQFTDSELHIVMMRIIKSAVYARALQPSAPPRAFLLGGQSGAGKTTLHDVLAEQCDGNVIVINGDEYRKHHPRFPQLQKLYGDKSVDYTAPWAGRMTEALVDRLSRLGYNLIIEGTLRTAEVPMKTATLLRERGYDVSLALMAVRPEISLVSCQLRYEEMRIAGTVPRATDPAHHNKIIDQIVDNLEVLEQSDLFTGITLYTRSRERIFPRDGFEGTASEALREKLFGPWTAEDRQHCHILEQRLASLQTK